MYVKLIHITSKALLSNQCLYLRREKSSCYVHNYTSQQVMHSFFLCTKLALLSRGRFWSLLTALTASLSANWSLWTGSMVLEHSFIVCGMLLRGCRIMLIYSVSQEMSIFFNSAISLQQHDLSPQNLAWWCRTDLYRRSFILDFCGDGSCCCRDGNIFRVFLVKCKDSLDDHAYLC